MVPEDPVVLLAQRWGLDTRRVEYPATGTMNEIAILTTDRGRFVLRGHRHRDRGRVDFEHRVMAFARSAGVPVPGALLAADGELVVEGPDGHFFSCFEHANGRQIAREALDERHADAMGQTLGLLHNALAAFPTVGAPRASRSCSYLATLARIEELLARLRSLDDPGEQERWAIERLESRAVWLAGRPDPQRTAATDEQIIHGDYQDSNLFFDNHGYVSSVIDWDKAEVRSRAEEVIRVMHLSLGLDPARCREFLHGYRNVAALSDDRLDQAAGAYGYQRACGLWLYETIYLAHDDRPRRFLTPGRFVAFADEWEGLHAALDHRN